MMWFLIVVSLVMYLNSLRFAQKYKEANALETAQSAVILSELWFVGSLLMMAIALTQ